MEDDGKENKCCRCSPGLEKKGVQKIYSKREVLSGKYMITFWFDF